MGPQDAVDADLIFNAILPREFREMLLVYEESGISSDQLLALLEGAVDPKTGKTGVLKSCALHSVRRREYRSCASHSCHSQLIRPYGIVLLLRLYMGFAVQLSLVAPWWVLRT